MKFWYEKTVLFTMAVAKDMVLGMGAELQEVYMAVCICTRS